MSERLFSVGAELGALDVSLLPGRAFVLSKGQSVTVDLHLANNTGEYDIPSGIHHSQRQMERPFTMTQDARLSGWGGYFHDYGISPELLINGKIVSTILPAITRVRVCTL